MLDTPPHSLIATSNLRARLAALMLGTALAAGALPLLSMPVSAQEAAAYRISLPAQPLASALSGFSDQTGLSVAVLGDIPAGARAPAVSGTLSANAALSRLLAGSGLSYTISPAGTVQIIGRDTEGADLSGDQAGEHLGIIVLGGRGVGAGLSEASSEISGEDIGIAFGGSPVAALRGTAGTYTRTPSDNPGITVNLRGLQGMGRVNTTIEGVPQTLRDVSGHGSSFDDQVFVDPGLMSGMDVSRGAVSGAAGLGTLAGAANVRMMTVDDVLIQGRDRGGLVRLRYGDNGSDWGSSLAGAMRGTTDSGLKWSGLAALSGADRGDYEDGEGRTVTTDSAMRSGMIRFDASPDGVHSFGVLALRNNTTLLPNYSSSYFWDTNKELVSLTYGYTPGDGIWDLKAQVYYQQDSISFPGDPRQFGQTIGARYNTNTNKGINVTNTTTLGDLSLVYGFAISESESIGNEASGANAEGKFQKGGLFLNAIYEYGKFDFNAGIRYDRWRMDGVSYADERGYGVCPPDYHGPRCILERETRDGGNWLPSLTIGYTPTDNIRLYASYSQTARPPALQEMFATNFGNYYGDIRPITQNWDMLAEEAENFELGLQYASTSLFTENDRATFGITAFRTGINNYVTTRGTLAKNWYNVTNRVRLHGVELQGSYENDRFFAQGSYTRANNDDLPWPFPVGFGSDRNQQPEDFGSLNLGVKLLGGDAMFGTVVRYTGPNIRGFFTEQNSTRLPAYTLVDLYGKWDVSENIEVFGTVTNILDKGYFQANSGPGDYSSNRGGPGREFQIGANFRF